MLASSDSDSCLDANATLFVEGEAAGDIHELVSGVVRLSRTSPDDRREILGFVFPGELFSSSGFGLAEPQTAICTADALTPVRVRAHPWSRLDDLLAERPDFLGRMLAAVRRDLFYAERQRLLLGRMSALERVVWFLLLMARLENTGDDVPLYLPMSWEDVADHLGITTGAVYRVFFQLHRYRLARLEEASTIRITDWHSMRLLARNVRLQKGWWSRLLAEALSDLDEPERRIFLDDMVRRGSHALQARARTGDIPADRLRQVQIRAIANLRQRATNHPED